MEKAERNWKLYQRIFLLLVADILFVVLSSFLAMFIRMEFQMDWMMWANYVKWVWLDIVIVILNFTLFRLYKSLWTFASMIEMRNLISAMFTIAFEKVFFFVIVMGVVLPRSWYILDPLILFCLCCFTRFSYRNIRSIRNNMNYRFNSSNKEVSNVMIVGAGEAGNMLLREITLSHFIDKKVVCFIDDDPLKKGRYMNGVIIAGNRDKILECVKTYHVNEIYIALPSASPKERGDIIEICKHSGCVMKILPGIYQVINGEVSVSKLRNVEIEDLLGRDPIKVDLNQIASYIKGKVVMVTGGGGSIGSELCRQVAKYEPEQLIIVDIYENNAYAIQLELKDKYPDLDLDVCIASIRDEKKVNYLFEKYHPDVVYHAAAHKHVPLMEDSPTEAVKNNVFGTLNVVRAADKYHTKRFVQISTDKAVNPTNIMGATKRICEMIIQAYDKHSETEYAAVRFGNVLGSNGSVIPIFKEQIAKGGPVTVTDKNIIRYFMTIPEAVSLVMQAGVYAKGGEIFVLDMGKPMKIDDLARNMIRLSGYTPDVDIPIIYTGLRPGEKLYEELLMGEEGLQKTENLSVFIGEPIKFDNEAFFNQLKTLWAYVNENPEKDEIKLKVHEIVPTYKPWLAD